jgi:TPR repeat protein
MFFVAKCCRVGVGVEADAKLEAQWLSRAAAGNELACILLAVHVRDGMQNDGGALVLSRGGCYDARC